MSRRPYNTCQLHTPEGGIIQSRIDFGPMQFASEIARYISCPSTVRVRTLERWGRAPSIERIRLIQEQYRANRESYRSLVKAPDNEADLPDYSFKSVIPARRLPKAPKPAAERVEFVMPVAPREPLTVARLIKEIAAEFGQTYADMIGTGRAAKYQAARRTCCVVLYNLGLSYPRVGERLGGRDHTTIMHACRMFEIHATPHMRKIAAIYSKRVLIGAAASNSQRGSAA